MYASRSASRSRNAFSAESALATSLNALRGARVLGDRLFLLRRSDLHLRT
jgi:hypothetical protein